MIRLLAVLCLLVAARADAKVLTEASVVCDGQLTASLDNGGNPHVYASCTTFDASGTIVRAVRVYDVTSQLTAQQKSGVQTILQSLPTFVGQGEAIPTPTPRQTP